MNLYSVIILAALLGEFALSVVSSVLNLRALHPILPAEFEDVFDADRYAQSQRYTRSQTKLGLVRSSVSLAAVVAVWQLGGFEWLDRAAQDLGFGSVLTGLIYIGSLGLGATALGLPFRLYSTLRDRIPIRLQSHDSPHLRRRPCEGHRSGRGARWHSHDRGALLLSVGRRFGLAVVLADGGHLRPDRPVHRPNLDHATVQCLHTARCWRAP